MSNGELLGEGEIENYMEDLPLWHRENNVIIRNYVAQSFVDAVGLISLIVINAEVKDHHLDICLYGWNKLQITLTTHNKDGLTELDFELARKIENLLMKS